MKRIVPLALIAASLPLAAAADIRVERIYTDDGRVIEQRTYVPGATDAYSNDRAYRQWYSDTHVASPYYDERSYPGTAYPVTREYPLGSSFSGAAIHTGANNAADQALADRVGQEFASDRRLNGITATVVANDGRVMLSGSAKSPEQASIAENDARRIAGVANVSGTLSSEGQ